MMNAQRSQVKAFISRIVGYNSFQDEKERKQKGVLSNKIFKSIIECKEPIEGYEKETAIAKNASLAINAGLDGLALERKDVEKRMAYLAEQLPVHDWWVSEKGRAVGGLSVIIGESGNLSDYENPAKVWKRFGLAVMEGVRQGGLAKGSSAEQWIEHGYNKRRRSVVWTIGDSLIKTNKDDKGDPGFYKKIYNERKEYETKNLTKTAKKAKEKFKPIVAHRKAQRYMEKRLLRDLWNEWNK